MKKIVLLAIGVVFTTTFAFAQILPPPPPEDQDGPDPVPVDGGACFLLAAGASYGIKKMKARRLFAKA
jgi:hypothetical protein